MEDLLSKLLPILLLLLIGFVSKQLKVFSDSFIEELKGLIIKIALPAVLFDAFSTMKLQVSYLLLFSLVFIYCIILYGIGHGLHKFFPKVFSRYYTKGFMTGFEFGMIGVGLFGAIWGIDKLPIIMLVAFGHELFIWFFYVLFISKSTQKSYSLSVSLKQFIKTPTIIAIILGIVVNLSGIYPLMKSNVIGQSLFAVVEFLKPLTSPLILLIIGYTMGFHRTNLKEVAVYIITRIVLVMSLGTLLVFTIINIIPDIDPLFVQAFYAFILLPAPYILPLYIKNQEESTFFTQVLVYNTVITFIGYGVLLYIL